MILLKITLHLFMNDNHTLSREDYYRWLKDNQGKTCPFCGYKNNQIILKEFDRWVWIASKAPYWGYHTLLLPKRHVDTFSELSEEEFKDLFTLHNYIVAVYKKADLTWPDGQPIDGFLTFWRERKTNFDSIIGANKISHVHIHYVPETEHSWDAIVDPNAYKISYEPLKDALNDLT